jgi:DNA-binding transcriptional regulator YiaG
MIITLQPSAAGTSARFVHTTGQPPSLMIHDGTTTLVMRPADSADGLVDAAEFAEELIQVVSEWESGCRRTLDAIQPDNPDDAQVPAAEHDPNMPMISRHHQVPFTIKPDNHNGDATLRSAPKPTRRTALATARKAAGFTQEELAARLGVERSTVYRWETGETTPMPMLRPGLAKLLRLEDDQLSALLQLRPVDGPANGGIRPHPCSDQQG